MEISNPSLFLYWQASLIDEEEEIVELLSTSTRHKLSIAAAYLIFDFLGAAALRISWRVHAILPAFHVAAQTSACWFGFLLVFNRMKDVAVLRVIWDKRKELYWKSPKC